MSSTFKKAVPVFAVADVGATARWYRQYLGFEFDHFPPQEPWEWAGMWRDTAEIMLQRVPGHRNPDLDPLREGGVWDAYIRVSDIRPLYDRLRRELPLRRELCPQFYGALEFELLDPNGYVLVFSEMKE